MLVDHPRKFLEGVTLRVISFAVICQYFLHSCISSNQINIIFIPHNGTFTSKIKRGSNFFHFSIGLDAQCRWRWNEYLSLLIIRRGVQEKYAILKGNGSCSIWQSNCPFLKGNYVYFALLIVVYDLLTLRNIRKQPISLLLLTVLSDLQPKLQSLSFLTIPKTDVVSNSQGDFIESTPIKEQLPSNHQLILQFIEVMRNKFINILPRFMILLRQKSLLLLRFTIGCILFLDFLLLRVLLIDKPHEFLVPHTPLGQYSIIQYMVGTSCCRFKIIILEQIIKISQGLLLGDDCVGYLRDRVQFVGYGEGEALHYVGLEGYAEVVSLVVVEGREQTLYLVCQGRFYLVSAGGESWTLVQLFPSLIEVKNHLLWQASTLLRHHQVALQLTPHKLLNLLHFFFVVVFFPQFL